MKRITRDDTEHGVEYSRADKVDSLLADQPAQQSRSDYRDWDYQDLQDDQLAQQEPEQQEPDWKDRLIAQHEETILWQAKRIAELLDAPQPSAQQEPVAWPCVIAEADFEQNTITLEMQCSDYKVGAGQHWLYTSPPAQRTWVGLTDEGIWLEYQNFWPFHPAEEPTLAKDIVKFARAIEAKLKEKNT